MGTVRSDVECCSGVGRAAVRVLRSTDSRRVADGRMVDQGMLTTLCPVCGGEVTLNLLGLVDWHMATAAARRRSADVSTAPRHAWSVISSS